VSGGDPFHQSLSYGTRLTGTDRNPERLVGNGRGNEIPLRRGRTDREREQGGLGCHIDCSRHEGRSEDGAAVDDADGEAVESRADVFDSAAG
jgi:hypothetical protein